MEGGERERETRCSHYLSSLAVAELGLQNMS